MGIQRGGIFIQAKIHGYDRNVIVAFIEREVVLLDKFHCTCTCMCTCTCTHVNDVPKNVQWYSLSWSCRFVSQLLLIISFLLLFQRY